MILAYQFKDEINAEDVDSIYKELDATRPILKTLLASLKPGDTLAVASFSELAETIAELDMLLQSLGNRSVSLKIAKVPNLSIVSTPRKIPSHTPAPEPARDVKIADPTREERAPLEEPTEEYFRPPHRPRKVLPVSDEKIREWHKKGYSLRQIAKFLENEYNCKVGASLLSAICRGSR